MKGVILAGGTGSRLYPLTKITNKHLLPVYNKPMVYYPLFTLKEAGITDVLIVSGKGHCGNFLELLGSGSRFGMHLSYEVQEEAGGIAQALGLAENFADGDKIMVILGDNILEDNLSKAVKDFEKQKNGAKIFLKSVKNPESYGVAEFTVSGKFARDKIVRITEKPKHAKSNLAVIGCYMYDHNVFEIIKKLKPSKRNELEITDVNSAYLKKGALSCDLLSGFWGDCGESFDSLLETARMIKASRLAKMDEQLNSR